MTVRAAIEDFTARLQALIEGQALEQARSTVLTALGIAPRRGPGRPRKEPAAASVLVAKKPRKKAPVQLCPVPGCKNKAAPIFGMVCSKHRDVAKSKIKKYRETRKAKKAKVAG